LEELDGEEGVKWLKDEAVGVEGPTVDADIIDMMVPDLDLPLNLESV